MSVKESKLTCRVKELLIYRKKENNDWSASLDAINLLWFITHNSMPQWRVKGDKKLKGKRLEGNIKGKETHVLTQDSTANIIKAGTTISLVSVLLAVILYIFICYYLIGQPGHRTDFSRRHETWKRQERKWDERQIWRKARKRHKGSWPKKSHLTTEPLRQQWKNRMVENE